MAASSAQLTQRNISLVYCLVISALIALTNWFLLPLPRVLAGYNWSAQRIGWTMGMFLGAWTLGQLFSGMVSRLIGSRALALVGSMLGIVGGLCYLIFTVLPYAIFPARIFHGVGSAFVYSGVMFLLLDRLPIGDRAKTIGYYGLPGVAMTMVGPSVAETLERYYGVFPVLLLVALVFCGLFFGIWKFSEIYSLESISATTRVGQFRVIITRTYLGLMLLMVLGACSSAWQTFLAPLVVLLDPGALSKFAVGHGLGAVVSRLGASARVDKGSPRLAAILGLIVYGGGLALIPKANWGWQLALIGFFIGVTYGLAFVAIISLTLEKMPTQEASVGASFLLASIGFGGFLGPPIWGVVADNFGFNITFVLSGCALMIAAGVFVISELAPQTTLIVRK